jgi:hypothetical protein
MPFDMSFLPAALAPWISDIAKRLQCPPDYVAISAVVALGSVIGRRVGIKPQAAKLTSIGKTICHIWREPTASHSRW